MTMNPDNMSNDDEDADRDVNDHNDDDDDDDGDDAEVPSSRTHSSHSHQQWSTAPVTERLHTPLADRPQGRPVRASERN
jgi:hypothetical protein